MSRFTTSRRAALALVLSCSACTKAPAPPTEKRSDAGMAALAALMKNQINPAFSKLTFLVFHAEELQEDPNAVRAELQRFATMLRGSILELRDWKELPTQSREGRDVFFAYAQNLEFHVARLEDAAAHHQEEESADTVEEIRQTCNHCHRFFRPASLISPDVAYDWYALELFGGAP